MGWIVRSFVGIFFLILFLSSEIPMAQTGSFTNVIPNAIGGASSVVAADIPAAATRTLTNGSPLTQIVTPGNTACKVKLPDPAYSPGATFTIFTIGAQCELQDDGGVTIAANTKWVAETAVSAVSTGSAWRCLGVTAVAT